ncbi:MAG: hypothetical protein WCH62_09345, partial [Candidatus Omnitrophota bacterium]
HWPSGAVAMPAGCAARCFYEGCYPTCIDDGQGSKTCGPRCDPNSCSPYCYNTFPGLGSASCHECPEPPAQQPSQAELNAMCQMLDQMEQAKQCSSTLMCAVNTLVKYYNTCTSIQFAPGVSCSVNPLTKEAEVKCSF